MMRIVGGCLWFVVIAGSGSNLWGEQQRTPTGSDSKAPAVDFVRDVQPLLKARCFKCHGAETQKGGLRLDVRARALTGGDSGTAIVAGQSGTSPLVERISSSDPAEMMPPAGERLTAAQVELIKKWIDQGACWPDDAAGKLELVKHWSFQPIVRPRVPDVRSNGWVTNPIDAFVLSRLEKVGVAPSPAADRRTLLRRLSLDMIGLAPTPEETKAFLADESPEAYESLVDRLLRSAHFGERWARHWLDLARYGDSHGYENDGPRPQAHLFRDWVIAAYNNDLPFDQFTIEQLAGDLLPKPTRDQLIAAGFHRNAIEHNSGEKVQEEYRIKTVKDRAETTANVWLGLTLGCCQCHSHKFDPLTQTEYYGMFAFFNNSDDCEQDGVRTTKPAKRSSHLHLRGDFLKLGPEVAPHTPAALPPLKPRGAIADRLDLARWLVDPANPLTPRVTVNYYWQHLFGQGLVTTSEDFGVKGDPPTHPELLDWLAKEFVSSGSSPKALIRLIVCSATYRQSSAGRTDLQSKDPLNALLARQNRFRVEAEIMYDLAMQASGKLNLQVGGPAIQPQFPAGVAKLPIRNESLMDATKGPEQYRRGIYIHVQRTFQHPLLATFDACDGNQSCARRDRSNTPLQALTLLNDPVYRRCARDLAERLLAERAKSVSERIERAFDICLSRPPTAAERQVLETLLQKQGEHYTKKPEEAKRIWGEKSPTNGSFAEGASWINLAGTLLNLEEFFVRE